MKEIAYSPHINYNTYLVYSVTIIIDVHYSLSVVYHCLSCPQLPFVHDYPAHIPTHPLLSLPLPSHIHYHSLLTLSLLPFHISTTNAVCHVILVIICVVRFIVRFGSDSVLGNSHIGLFWKWGQKKAHKTILVRILFCGLIKLDQTCCDYSSWVLGCWLLIGQLLDGLWLTFLV